MSLSRSPSPRPGGGWSSPGLTAGSGTSTPRGFSPSPASLAPSGLSWAAAKAKSDEVRGYPSFSTRNSGFFSRQKRQISARLPSFRGSSVPAHGRGYVDKDEYGGQPWRPGGPGARGSLRMLWRRKRMRVLAGLTLAWFGYLLFWSCEFVASMRWLLGCLLSEIANVHFEMQSWSSYTDDHRWAEVASSSSSSDRTWKVV